MEPVLPSPLGSVQNSVSMMEHEHDSAGNALRAMREASSGYTAPEACISYQTLYKALADFEGERSGFSVASRSRAIWDWCR
jgi:regulator of cell morphogenesis and NO signaling